MPLHVDYDRVDHRFNQRYERQDYAGIEATALAFVGSNGVSHVAEVGCGSGHWLSVLDTAVAGLRLAGLDPSRAMLAHARAAAPHAMLVRGRAEYLPWRSGTFDRLLCINVLHHVVDRRAFCREAWRVLRAGGEIMIVGLDPHPGRDRWWVYDYFPGALIADRMRYLSVPAVRGLLIDAGFEPKPTFEAEHLSSNVPVSVAAEQGLLERTSTSQLMVISDDEYEAGMTRLRTDRRGPGIEPVLKTDIRLHATIGRRSA